MPRHAQFTSVIITCDNCGCRISIQTGRRQRRNICQDCLDMMRLEQSRQRTTWRSQCTYHLVYDPDNSWGYDCWFGLKEIIECPTNFTPGTRFDAKGVIYEVTADYRLMRLGEICQIQ